MAQLQWFYSSNGGQAGPVSDTELKALAASGQLKLTDLIWRDGLADWMPAATALPGLFETPMSPPMATPVHQPAPHASANVLPYVGGGSVGADPGVTPRVLELLGATRPWVLLISIVMFLGTALVAIAGVFVLGAGLLGAASGGRGSGAFGAFGVIFGLIVLGMSLLSFVPAMYLARYASRIATLRLSRRVLDLEGALEAQKSYWKFIGIMILIYLGIYLMLFVIGGLSSIR